MKRTRALSRSLNSDRAAVRRWCSQWSSQRRARASALRAADGRDEDWDRSDLEAEAEDPLQLRQGISRRQVYALRAKNRLRRWAWRTPRWEAPELRCQFSFRLSQKKFQHWDQALVLLAEEGQRLYYLSQDMTLIAQLLYPTQEKCERSYLFFQDQVLIVINSTGFAKPVIIDFWSRQKSEASALVELIHRTVNRVLAAHRDEKARLLRSPYPQQVA